MRTVARSYRLSAESSFCRLIDGMQALFGIRRGKSIGKQASIPVCSSFIEHRELERTNYKRNSAITIEIILDHGEEVANLSTQGIKLFPP